MQQTAQTLAPLPELATRSNNVFRALINGLLNMLGEPLMDEDNNQVEQIVIKPIEKLSGITFKHNQFEASQPISTGVQVEKQMDLSTLKTEVDEALKTFAQRQPKELKDSLPDIVIRGVAKKAGMKNVSETNPERITHLYIKQIQDRMQQKQDAKLAEALEENKL